MTTSSHGTVCEASSANMAQGVCPPLTAKWKLPRAATASRARSATNAAPRPGYGIGVGESLEFVVHVPPYWAFSAWPPNSLRIAERILSVNSPSPRDSNRSKSEVVMTVRRDPLVDGGEHRPSALAGVRDPAGELVEVGRAGEARRR